MHHKKKQKQTRKFSTRRQNQPEKKYDEAYLSLEFMIGQRRVLGVF